MSKLVENMVGEYILVSTEIYPATAIWYKDKTVVKTESFDSIIDYITKIIKMMKLEDNIFYQDIMNGRVKDYILECVLNEKGVHSYSVNLKYWEDLKCKTE